MNENRNVEREDNIIRTLVTAFKRFWALMLVIVIFAAACGTIFSFLKKPNYTATEKVVYKGQNSYASSTVNNINAMNAFVGTIVDFCDEGVVIDRANFYYAMYLNAKVKEGTDYSVEDYITTVKANDTYKGEAVKAKRIVSSNVLVESKKQTDDEDNASKFSFSISYTDPDRNVAIDKVKILVLAVDMESKETVIVDNVSERKYFDGINNEIMDFGTEKVVSDVSKPKIIIVSVLIGIILSFVAIYMITVLDNTVKTKEELEEIVGVDTLSFIDYQGGK